MGNKDRRTPTPCRRITDLERPPRAVKTLEADQDLSQDEIFVDGMPVIAPGIFGSDGMDHWLGTPRVSPGGSVSIFKH